VQRSQLLRPLETANLGWCYFAAVLSLLTAAVVVGLSSCRRCCYCCRCFLFVCLFVVIVVVGGGGAAIIDVRGNLFQHFLLEDCKTTRQSRSAQYFAHRENFIYQSQHSPSSKARLLTAELRVVQNRKWWKKFRLHTWGSRNRTVLRWELTGPVNLSRCKTTTQRNFICQSHHSTLFSTTQYTANPVRYSTLMNSNRLAEDIAFPVVEGNNICWIHILNSGTTVVNKIKRARTVKGSAWS